MQDLVDALKNAGVSPWLIVTVLALIAMARPLYKFFSAVATWVRGRPSLAVAVANQMAEINTAQRQLGDQQGAFFDRVQRMLDEARADAADANRRARKAQKATEDCEKKHQECIDRAEALEDRIVQLEEMRDQP